MISAVKKKLPIVDLNDIKFTYKDYVEFPDDGKRYQIIEGDLLMSPSPRMLHQFIVRNLTQAFSNYLARNPVGIFIPSPADVVLSDTDVVQPDAMVILVENNDIITDTNISGVPDFVVEILSPFNRALDVKRKRRLYEQFGVKEYWIVDPDLESVQKLILEKGKYIDGGMFEIGQTISSDIVKGFTVDLKDVFKR